MIPVGAFFGIGDSELSVYLDYTSPQCKAAAYLGDRLLSFLLARRALERQRLDDHFESGSAGTLAERNKLYERNSTQASFLTTFTNASDFIEPPENGSSLSEHTLATVFEALLAGCYTANGLDGCVFRVDLYVGWVDQNTSDGGPIEYTPVPLPSVPSSRLPQAQEDRIIAVNASSRGLAVLETGDEPREHAEPGERPVPQAGDEHKEEEGRDLTVHSAVSLIHVPWTSRKGFPHTDQYYPCCGLRSIGHVASVCLRSIYPDPEAVHPGSLRTPIPGSRRTGGGTQHRDNHIALGQLGVWTCCGKPAYYPGCQKASFPGTEEEYSELLKAWLKNYRDFCGENHIVPDRGWDPGRRMVLDKWAALMKVPDPR